MAAVDNWYGLTVYHDMLTARGTTQTTERLARMPGSNDRGTAVGFRNNLNLKTVGVPYSIVSSKNRNVVGGLFDTLLGCSWWRFGLVLGSAIVICQVRGKVSKMAPNLLYRYITDVRSVQRWSCTNCAKEDSSADAARGHVKTLF